MTACRFGQVEQVKSLLAQGANPNVFENGAHTPLHIAVDGKSPSVVRLLIKAGADVNAKGDNQYADSVLHRAAGSSRPEMVKILLDAGAKPDRESFAQANWLGHKDAVELLLDAGAVPDDGLPSAAQGGHLDLVQLLLDKGANPNAAYDDGSTALQVAALQGGPEVVQLLLKRGADPNARSKDGKTPLHAAVGGDGNVKIVKLLLAAGAKPALADVEGVTSVRLAGQQGGGAAYEALLAACDGKEPTPVYPPAFASPESEKKPKSAADIERLLDRLAGNDPEEQVAAKRDLVALGQAAVPQVVQRIKAGRDAEKFLVLLTTLGPAAESAIPAVAELLDRKETALSAMIALERMKPGAVKSLTDDVRRKAAASLYEAVVDPDTEDMLKAFNADALLSLGTSGTPEVLKLLRDPNPAMRHGIARRLSRVGGLDPAVLEELKKITSSDELPENRIAAAESLTANGGSKDAVKNELLTILKSSPPHSWQDKDLIHQRENAAWRSRCDDAARALARFGPQVIDDLLPLLTPLDRDQRHAALETLKHLGPPAQARLIQLLEHQDHAVAVSAAVALDWIMPPDLAALTKVVEEGSDEAAGHAAHVLQRHARGAGPPASALLALANDKNRPSDLRVQAVVALRKIDPKHVRQSPAVKECVEYLAQELSVPDYQRQVQALDSLMELGSWAVDAVPALEDRAKNPQKHVVKTGFNDAAVRSFARSAIDSIERDVARDEQEEP